MFIVIRVVIITRRRRTKATQIITVRLTCVTKKTLTIILTIKLRANATILTENVMEN